MEKEEYEKMVKSYKLFESIVVLWLFSIWLYLETLDRLGLHDKRVKLEKTISKSKIFRQAG